MKKFIKVAFVAAIAAVAGYGVYENQKTEPMSDLALSNVEALAQNESGDVYCCGKFGTCMLILGGGQVKGIKLYNPCP